MIRLIFPLFPLIILFLTACSTILPKDFNYTKNCNSSQWIQHQKKLYSLNQYQTYGKFAYFSDKKKIYANFFWQKNNQGYYHLLLTNPLGGTELELKIWPNLVQIFDSEGQYYTCTDAEEILNKFTEILIPFNILQQWILGLPGDITDYKLSNQCLLSEIHYKQNGKLWKLIYKSYDNKIRPVLPKNMELINDNQHLKIKIDNWTIR